MYFHHIEGKKDQIQNFQIYLSEIKCNTNLTGNLVSKSFIKIMQGTLFYNWDVAAEAAELDPAWTADGVLL